MWNISKFQVYLFVIISQVSYTTSAALSSLGVLDFVQPVALVLAGMELIFSLVAGTVVWVGFRVRRMLVTQGCLSWC